MWLNFFIFLSGKNYRPFYCTPQLVSIVTFWALKHYCSVFTQVESSPEDNYETDLSLEK